MADVKKRTFISGLGFSDISDNADVTLKHAMDDGYDFITTNLSFRLSRNCPPRIDITSLKSKWWSTSIIGEIGQATLSNKTEGVNNKKECLFKNNQSVLYNNVSGKNIISRLAERNIYEMVDWACHMNIPVVVFPIIPTESFLSIQYAQAISSLAAKCSASNIQIWVRVPFRSEYLEAFQLLHRHCDDMSNVGCLLILDDMYEDNSSSSSYTTRSLWARKFSLLHRFVGSNTRAISIHTSLFLMNKQGYPTLPKSLQNIFLILLQRIGRTLRVMVEGKPNHQCCSSSIEVIQARGKSGYLGYLQYLRHLRAYDKVTDVLDAVESVMEESYLDQLQTALQPLGDHLEFQIYENFESDQIKYSMYRSAVELALRDGIRLKHFHITKNNNAMEVTILVLGAGRGPLIKMSLEAISNINESLSEECFDNDVDNASSCIVSRIQPIIVAIEKNPSAVLYLHSLLSSEVSWQDIVEIVQCDMRYAKLHQHKYPVLGRMIHDYRYKADVVISELLGSFGDNELSPECLDGVQFCGLMKNTCVSIPQKYTSFLSPVSSMTLHSHARSQAYAAYNSFEGPAGKPCGILQAMETPYVVRPHSASQTHKEMPCWEFSHPSTVSRINHNNNGERQNKFNSSPCSLLDTMEEMDNTRFVQIIFSPDIMNGMKYGCGYGPVDTALEAFTTDISQDEFRDITYSSNTIHGFLGTFNCILYQSIINENSKIVISTAPSEFSKGMFSWFPLYFPLREPMQVPAGSSICCNMWRKTTISSERSGGRVWYEWCANVYYDENSGKSVVSSSSIHNPYGRSSHIRL